MTATFSSPQEYERKCLPLLVSFPDVQEFAPLPLLHPAVRCIAGDLGYYKEMKTLLFLEIVHLKFCTLVSEVIIKFLYFFYNTRNQTAYEFP